MSTQYVIAVIGDDRPGLVELLASAVAEHQGSWLESRMSVLAGQFSGVALVQVPDERADALEKTLHELGDERLRLTLVRAGARKPPRPHHTARLEVVGHDRPGIVQEITRVLRDKGINIDNLVTERMSGAMSGGHLFHAVADLQVPESIETEGLRNDLEGLANELMVDIHVEEVAGDAP